LSTKIKCQAIPEEAVTIDNSTVLVVGGGGVGMEVVRSFAKAGSWVTAYQRGEKFRKEIEELGAMLAIGDVLDVGAIEKTLRGNSFDAIVCTVGRLPVRLPSQYLQINWLEEFPYLALLDFLLSSQQFLFHLHSGFLCNFLQGCFISCIFSVASLCLLQLSTRRRQSPC
jgi:nucleoside-diphosphate-sugar epimerase